MGTEQPIPQTFITYFSVLSAARHTLSTRTCTQLSLNCDQRYKTLPPPPLKQRNLSKKICLFTLGEHKCCDPKISPPQHHLVQSCSAKGWHPEPRCPLPAFHPPNDSCLKIICCFWKVFPTCGNLFHRKKKSLSYQKPLLLKQSNFHEPGITTSGAR